MAQIEHIYEHKQEDWAIQMMATNLMDDLKKCGYIVKKELPYFNAIMSAIAHHPDSFRRRGYSITEMRFSQHKHDKKGKVVSCVADFGDRVPTDAEIEKTCKIGVCK